MEIKNYTPREIEQNEDLLGIYPALEYWVMWNKKTESIEIQQWHPYPIEKIEQEVYILKFASQDMPVEEAQKYLIIPYFTDTFSEVEKSSYFPADHVFAQRWKEPKRQTPALYERKNVTYIHALTHYTFAMMRENFDPFLQDVLNSQSEWSLRLLRVAMGGFHAHFNIDLNFLYPLIDLLLQENTTMQDLLTESLMPNRRPEVANVLRPWFYLPMEGLTEEELQGKPYILRQEGLKRVEE